MTPQAALTELGRHTRVWTVLDVTVPVIITAARAVHDHQLNFWDAQLWAVARLNGVEMILSEDFNTGSTLEGVHFANPFHRLPFSGLVHLRSSAPARHLFSSTL